MLQVNYKKELAPNVTFHKWCVGTSSNELKLDGLAADKSKKLEFYSLPDIVRRLGHEGRKLTVLKVGRHLYLPFALFFPSYILPCPDPFVLLADTKQNIT